MISAHIRLAALLSVVAAISMASLVILAVGTSADPAIDAEEADFLVRINQYRAENGLGALALNNDLSEASDWFSNDMAADNYFPPDHIDNENPPRNPTQRSNAFGWVGQAGENIAAGTARDTGEEAFIAWKNSPPHNANMLNGDYTVIGIGRAFNANATYGWYWTTNFGITDVVNTPAPTVTEPGQTPAPTVSVGPTPPPQADAIVDLLGCNDNTLAANDDGSSPQFNTSFPLNFFGQTYNSLYVNNNGNITFDSSLGTYTPFGLQGAATKIIAAFFADVDTEGSGSGLVRYGNGVYSGNRTFCANWINVGYFNNGTDKLNSFQIMLVERADQGAGDFDIMMNFDKVKWEAASTNGGVSGICGGTCAPARMGYSNGTNNSYELPGSGVPGAFLDSNANGLIKRSENSLVPGRYVYFVRNGAPATGGTISGKVYADSVAPGNVIPNAPVQICGIPGCYTAATNDLGEFVIRGLDPATYSLRIFPGNDVALVPNEFGGQEMTQDGAITGLELVLHRALVPPADTTISSRFTSGGVPAVFWAEPVILRTTGCPAGTATFEVRKDGVVLQSGGMTEDPTGRYTAEVPPLAPAHGPAAVHININCPAGGPQTKDFNIYIDPSGNVRTVDGRAIVGARVTLYRAESPAGPFTIVPNGSTIMSPSNRTNPDLTNGEGHFGWDVIAGFYKVRAELDGCANPGNPQQPYTETEALEIPPPVFDLDIRLDCPSESLPFPRADVNCSGAVGGEDALLVINNSLDLGIDQPGGCPEIGGATAGAGIIDAPLIFGDADCDGSIDIADALAILRNTAKLQVSLPIGCPAVDA